MKTLYTAHGSATGGREGHGASSDTVLDVTLTTPKELGGNGATGITPEQLFAVGYSACFLGAMKFVAGQDKIKIPEDTKVSADVGIGPRDDGTGFGINVALHHRTGHAERPRSRPSCRRPTWSAPIRTRPRATSRRCSPSSEFELAAKRPMQSNA